MSVYWIFDSKFITNRDIRDRKKVMQKPCCRITWLFCWVNVWYVLFCLIFWHWKQLFSDDRASTWPSVFSFGRLYASEGHEPRSVFILKALLKLKFLSKHATFWTEDFCNKSRSKKKMNTVSSSNEFVNQPRPGSFKQSRPGSGLSGIVVLVQLDTTRPSTSSGLQFSRSA